MNCYLCETSQHPDGTLYDVRPAIGICQLCGIGLCKEHGTKSQETGSRLLCADCSSSLANDEQRAA